METIATLIQLFPFALGIGFMMSVLSPLYGVNVILKRIIIVSITLPQASVLGIALGHLFNIPTYVSSSIITMAAGLILSYPFERLYISREGISVFIFLFCSAATFLIINFSHLHFDDIKYALYGNFLISNKNDLIVYTIFFLISVLYMTKFIKSSLLVTTDYTFAKSININVGLIETLYFIMLSLFISMTTKIAGTLLSFSSLIIPVYASFMLSNKFNRIFFYGIIFTLVTTFAGIYFSYTLDVSTSELIIILQLVLFIMIYSVKKIVDFLLIK